MKTSWRASWLAGLLTSMIVASLPVAAFSTSSSAQASASSALAVLRASASPLPPAHSVSLGALSPSVDLHLEVALKLPDPLAVTAFIASLSDRSSPNFHHFLRPGQFGQIFGPPLSEVTGVRAALRSEGLHPGQVSSDRLLIPVTAPASLIDRAFHVRLVRYRLPGGRAAFTTLSPPSMSAAVTPDIDGVIGLSNLIQPQSLLVRSRARREATPLSPRDADPATGGPTPCSDAAAANQYGGLTADQLAAYYDMTPLYSLGDFGQGVHVALAEFEPDLPSDISAYQACYGTDATVNYIPVDGGAASGPGTDPEAAMDIEGVIGLAPQATIDVYQAPSSSNSDVLDLYSDIVNDDTDPVVSTSWGECELDQEAIDSAFLISEQSLFQQAATQGQTVFAASGDTGSTDCLGDPKSTNHEVLAVDDPASQPYVVGIGGTSIGSGNSETVWNDQSGAGGGGVSSAWCMPAYQDQSSIQGLINQDSEQSDLVPGANCPAGSYMRQVPDVSADADPATGYIVYWQGSWSGVDGYVYGGTSAAAPLWAAAAALIDSSPFCADYGSGDAGVLPAGLYSIAALGSPFYGLALNDITTGDNDYAPSGYSGGLFPATVGYNMASGLGSPRLAYSNNYYPGLAAQMCLEYRTDLVVAQIKNVSPDGGPSGEPVSVTITGSGFLPIAGADLLQVGTNSITVSCSSTTSCTGTLPPGQPGTVDLVMSVEDTTVSPVVTADQFTFAAPPVITKITPAVGPETGGTTVTIRGSNFVGAVSVRFGNKTATAVDVISPSELSVAVPSGSGSAYVTVSTVAGSSPANPTTRYTFLAAPTITRISPSSGPTEGGTKVTIRGSNFVGAVSVRFGTRPATRVHVLSSSEITASAPPGSGTVHVVVSDAGGSSRVEPAGTYRY